MSWANLGWGAMLEVAIGLVLLAGAVVVYRRRAPDDGHYGSQGAVILGLIAIILLIHGFGALEYHPSQAEIEAFQERGR
jgi:hypothetical protein